MGVRFVYAAGMSISDAKKAFVVAAGSLGSVGLLLCAAIWSLLPTWYSEDLALGRDTPVERWPGTAFSVVVGRGTSQYGDARVVEELTDNQAVFLTRSMFAATDFPVLRLELSGVHPDLATELYWRTYQAPDKRHFLALQRGANEVTWHLLAGEEGWRGQIMEVGVVITGLHVTAPLQLHEVRFGQASRSVLARLTWQQWRTLAPWRVGSPNNYRGAPEDAPLSPVPTAALWLMGALLLLGAIAWQRGWPKTKVLPAALFVVLVPWLALDVLWQLRLGEQLAATQARFGGLDQAGKRDMEDDATLRQEALAVRKKLSPVRGRRVFMLRETMEGHDYHRLRAQYHLLPLNVYNFGGQLPEPQYARPGDYVLLLDAPGGVRFDADRDVLLDGNVAYAVQQVLAQSRMQLFRIEGGAKRLDPADFGDTL